MKLEISFNDQPKGIELVFSEEPSKVLALRLKAYGFKKGFLVPLKWTAAQHPAYITYAKALKESLLKKSDSLSVFITPSFQPSQENIDHNKFSYVTISYAKNGDKQQDNYVVFDSYLKVATAIATQYGKSKHKTDLIDVAVAPRKFKRKARKLLADGKVITGLEPHAIPTVEIKVTEEKHTNSITVEQKLTNEHGVYTKETAGDRFEKIEIPIPKNAKYSATISLVKGEDQQYRFGFSNRKEFGDASGQSSPVSKHSKSYPNRKEALERGVNLIHTRTLDEITRDDSILNNQDKKNKMLGTALKAVQQFAVDNGLTLDFQEEKKRPQQSSLNILRTPVKHAIEKLAAIEVQLDGEAETIIATTRMDFEEALEENKDTSFHSKLHKAIEDFKAFVMDITNGGLRAEAILIVYDIIDLLNEKSTTPHKKETPQNKSDAKSIPMDIVCRNKEIPNVLVPQGSKEPFISSSIFFRDTQKIQEASPNLLKLSDDKLSTASAVELFELSQMPHPNEHGINIHRSTLLKEWEKRGEAAFEELGFPTDTDYPYVNTNTAYKGVYPLSKILGEKGNHWWSVVENHRPIANLPKAITYINDRIKDLKDTLAATINPKTNKPKATEKEQYRKITWDIERFEGSQTDIEYYLKKNKKTVPKSTPSTSNEPKQTKKKTLEHRTKSFAMDIVSEGKTIKNVLVPKKVNEPFASGNLERNKKQQRAILLYPELNKKQNDASSLNALDLFRLTQIHHTLSIIQNWRLKGEQFFKALGFPTDYKYPYVSLYDGYFKILPLGEILNVGYYTKANLSWSVAARISRPIADIQKGLQIIDDYFVLLKEEQLAYNNDSNESLEQFQQLSKKLIQLKASKKVIQEYEKSLAKKETQEVPLPTPSASNKEAKTNKKTAKKSSDYLDKVIAHMHDKYAKAERPTKKQIEQMAVEIGVPNMGMMWEYTELSWLLWYKMLYKDTSSFENRLLEIIQFWDKGQPTYAYSDSSKEIYKQYSTPCPIGAIIAQYTGMSEANTIFEPSAGNGLLLVGADPKKTHVNEIDTTRTQSLQFQGFDKITHFNAAQPFLDEMAKKYDVVVTNPPFAKWEEEKFSKDYIVKKYFSSHRGLSQHIRLEHLMAGLALVAMKDNGKAAIIIMGHLYFGADGLLAKYRPFFNWLYRHYKVDDVINMNSFKLYNKQGAVAKTMLILIGGRKSKPSGVAPMQKEAPHLYDMVESFWELWLRVKPFIPSEIDIIIQQLDIELDGSVTAPEKEEPPPKMECYINYLDAKNRFKPTKKDFKNYEAAFEWMRQNLEKMDLDMIHYY